MAVAFGYTITYVADVAATVRFYDDAFGLATRFVTTEGDYGELETGATTLAFAATTLAATNLDAAGGFTPLDPASSPVGASITLTTDDVAATLQRAVDAGASLYVDPVEKPWGQTVAYVRDPNGLLVEIATPIPV